MNWYKQIGFACFPISVLNYALYLGKSNLPSLDKLIEIARCQHGATLEYQGVIEACGLKLVKDDSKNIIKQRGDGILTIINPGRGSTMHSCFFFKKDNQIYLINSTAPGRELEGVFTKKEMRDLMMKHKKHRTGYYVEE